MNDFNQVLACLLVYVASAAVYDTLRFFKRSLLVSAIAAFATLFAGAFAVSALWVNLF